MGYTSYGMGKEDAPMPWKETCVMDLKMQLIAAWLQGGHGVSDLARGYGISRKTAYKWIRRYQEEGAGGLQERSRAPHYCPHAVTEDVAEQIVAIKKVHPSFGPKKVLDRLRELEPAMALPADSTAGEILKAAGLVKKRRYKRPYPADPQPFELGDRNNALWSVDYKGQYRTAGGRWCYPLTVTDNASRYVLGCHGVSATDYVQAKPIMEWVFHEYGLPEGILSDNGAPFASRSAGGLTRLSKWWVELGIGVHRSKPGTPTQNARHERMHGSLNRAVGGRMRGTSLMQQQTTLQAFREEFNEQRSHEALGRQTPASVYQPSRRRYSPVLRPIEYNVDQAVRNVRHNGEIKWQGHLIYISGLLARHRVGLQEVENDRVEVRYSTHLLGHINLKTARLEPACEWHAGE
ncbi:integrase core domain-containing protein [Marinobacter nanhaiticus D15-8W]|nr:integrase core domain-containing protein [Marinobacter nanhaiticus]BES70295.1 integrase core domain-containing protein [Marinobacter nanhaiticus D15-8W]